MKAMKEERKRKCGRKCQGRRREEEKKEVLND